MKFQSISKMFSAETVLTVRALDRCSVQKLQEFARIIFVDDIFNYTSRVEDHRPLERRPTYESLDVPKIVNCINSTHST